MSGAPSCEGCGALTAPWPLDEATTLWRCPRCGHLGRDLTLAPAAARADQYSEAPGGALRTRLTLRRLLRRVTLAPGARVLDLGCGPDALLAGQLAARGWAVTGVDPSLSAAAAASGSRRGLSLHAGGIETVRDDVAAGRTPPFDLVTAVHVLEHLPDLRGALADVAAVLRPGGTLYAVTPDGGTRQLERFGAAWWMLEDPTHVRFLTARSAVAALSATGFHDVRTRTLVTDSLGADAGTVLRRVRSGAAEHGALGGVAATAVSVALLPVTLGARLVDPRWRPVLEVSARTPAAGP